MSVTCQSGLSLLIRLCFSRLFIVVVSSFTLAANSQIYSKSVYTYDRKTFSATPLHKKTYRMEKNTRPPRNWRSCLPLTKIELKHLHPHTPPPSPSTHSKPSPSTHSKPSPVPHPQSANLWRYRYPSPGSLRPHD